MQATLGGLTFIGDDSPATYTIESLRGWFDGVEMRHESVARPNGNGDFDAPGYLGPRLITLEGLILAADNPVAFETAWAALGDLLSDGSMDTFTVTSALGTYTAEVRRHGAVDVSSELYGSRARYQLQLWAPDPTKVFVP